MLVKEAPGAVLAIEGTNIRGYKTPEIQGLPENSVHIMLPLLAATSTQINGRTVNVANCFWVSVNKTTGEIITKLRPAKSINRGRVKPFTGKRTPAREDFVYLFDSKYDATKTFESCIAHAFANKIAFDPKPEKIQILNPIFVPDPTTGRDTPLYLREGETPTSYKIEDVTTPFHEKIRAEITAYNQVDYTKFIKEEDLKKEYEACKAYLLELGVAKEEDCNYWLNASFN